MITADCTWCRAHSEDASAIVRWQVYSVAETFTWRRPDLPEPTRVHVRPGQIFIACLDCSALMDGRKVGALLARRPADALTGPDDAAFTLALLDALQPPVTLFDHVVDQRQRSENDAGETERPEGDNH